jgi:hypothetical protein
LLIVSPDSQASACPLSGRNSTYLAVRICGATSGRRSFYSTILNESRPFVRFDPGCMQAVSLAGFNLAKALAASIATFTPTTIQWRAGDILIIDNWRVLHGRGLPNTRVSTDRRLLRVAVR